MSTSSLPNGHLNGGLPPSLRLPAKPVEAANAVAAAVKDRQTVSSAGQRLERRIAGVTIHRRPLQEDERGELQEIYSQAWGLHPDPLVYAYFVGIRPGQVKGWVVHRLQDDRIFLTSGLVHFALYDDRADSPTFRMVNDFVVSDRSRSLIVIPRGVFHALKNIGSVDASFINLPTAAYDHANPDKHRLPLTNDLIPFSFDDRAGAS